MVACERLEWEEEEPLLESTVLVYSIIRKASGSIGGNGSGGGIYGELTAKSFQRILAGMKRLGLSRSSKFLDIGSGLGKPNFHVAQDPGCVSIGIEVEAVRWQLAAHNLGQVHAARSRGVSSRVYFVQGDVSAATSLDPFSDVYMFDVGFPPVLFESLAASFRRSASCRRLASFQPPKILEAYGFDGFILCDKVSTSMHGSTECHTCFLYTVEGGEKEPPLAEPLFEAALALFETPDTEEALHADMADRLAASQAGRPRRRSFCNPHQY